MHPDADFTIGSRVGRGILYSCILVYLFVGISIVSDKFMESIEMITSQVCKEKFLFA
jgi:solute carrier family 8 (sodium/calcium exchanger)